MEQKDILSSVAFFFGDFVNWHGLFAESPLAQREDFDGVVNAFFRLYFDRVVKVRRHNKASCYAPST